MEGWKRVISVQFYVSASKSCCQAVLFYEAFEDILTIIKTCVAYMNRHSHALKYSITFFKHACIGKILLVFYFLIVGTYDQRTLTDKGT